MPSKYWASGGCWGWASTSFSFFSRSASFAAAPSGFASTSVAVPRSVPSSHPARTASRRCRRAPLSCRICTPVATPRLRTRGHASADLGRLDRKTIQFSKASVPGTWSASSEHRTVAKSTPRDAEDILEQNQWGLDGRTVALRCISTNKASKVNPPLESV